MGIVPQTDASPWGLSTNNWFAFRKKLDEMIRVVDSVRGDTYGASQELDNLHAALIRIETNLDEGRIALKTEQSILERFDELPVSETDLAMLVYNDSICKSLSETIAALSTEAVTNGGPYLPEDIADRVARRIERAKRDYERRTSELRK